MRAAAPPLFFVNHTFSSDTNTSASPRRCGYLKYPISFSPPMSGVDLSRCLSSSLFSALSLAGGAWISSRESIVASIMELIISIMPPEPYASP